MQRKTILTKLLTFGAVGISILAIICGCRRGETIVEPIYRTYSSYHNPFSFKIDIEGYKDGAVPNPQVYSIPVADSISFDWEKNNKIPFYYDSIRVVFDGKKELWHRISNNTPAGIYDFDANYQQVWILPYTTLLRYHFTQEHYDAATDIN